MVVRRAVGEEMIAVGQQHRHLTLALFVHHLHRGQVVGLQRAPPAPQVIVAPGINLMAARHGRQRAGPVVVHRDAALGQTFEVRRLDLRAVRGRIRAVQRVEHKKDNVHSGSPLASASMRKSSDSHPIQQAESGVSPRFFSSGSAIVWSDVF